MRPGESFQMLCTPEQKDKFERVAAHNGGAAQVERILEDGVLMRVSRVAENL